jgi:preprotein translocase subunit SecE
VEDGMSDDREQDQPEERESAVRPVTAAARRERRASARPASRKDDAKKVSKSDEDEDSASKKGRATRARDTQEKRPSLISRGFRYIREVVSELRKVIWPTRKQLVTYTGVVLVFVIVMVAFVYGLDIGFGWAVFELFG